MNEFKACASDPGAVEQAARALAGDGYAIIDGFLDPAALARWRAFADENRARLAPAAVGRGAARATHTAVRSDRIRWLESDEPEPVDALFARLDRWRAALNERLYLGACGIELHLACYAPGAAYARHRDRFRDDDARLLSVICYLNDADWSARDGGLLALELDGAGGTLEIVPSGGRLVMFRADRFWHAVTPSQRERWSVTGWMRRR